MAIPIPPPDIHSRVTRRRFDDQEYQRRAEELGIGLDSLMASHGLRMNHYRRVLDFGVGCGRILVNYEPLFEQVEFHGTDIDAITVDWCRANIPNAHFSVNGELPPLEFDDGFFDFIYAISVFTHLPEEMQTLWLAEVDRVLAPGGMFVATTCGDFCAELFLKEEDSISEYRRNGQKYYAGIADKILPDWYQSMFLSGERVFSLFSQYFDVVAHVPRGLCNYQDAVIVRKRSPKSVASSEPLAIAAQHWSRQVMSAAPAPRVRWWQSQGVCAHINKTICGKPVPGLGAGNVEALRQRYPGRVFSRGISVGCGLAPIETLLVQAGIVEHFDLFEIAEARIEQGRELARQRGLTDRLVYHHADAFSTTPPGAYDLVNWFDSLHHMLDVVEAIRWSRVALVEDGVLLMDEFVGPSYMQYTDRHLDLAEMVRAALPPRYLAKPGAPSESLPLRSQRPGIEALKAVDPTECADSGRILPALRLIFPAAEIVPTGGIAYHIALSDVLANIDEEADRGVLNLMLLADDLCTAQGQSLRAFACAARM